jgi:tetratricopeptide (TPR) repeat protein
MVRLPVAATRQAERGRGGGAWGSATGRDGVPEPGAEPGGEAAGRDPADRAGAAAEPASLESLLAAAEQAQRQSDWAVSEVLWREVRGRFPHVWFAYANGAVALCGLQRAEEARQVLAEAAERFPQEPSIPQGQGALEMGLALWSAAERHWRAALTFPHRAWWIFSELARALEEQGRVAEAEAVLLEGQAEDPNEPSLLMNYARLAWVREDWEAAVYRWAEANRRFAFSEPRASGLYQAFMRLAEHDPAAAERAHRELGLALPNEAAEDGRRTLMLQFESLGGAGPDGGCEFGGNQREHGAEPLGLLRWATVTPEALIACLHRRFEEYGEADTTTVVPHDEMWEIVDTAFGTSMHSFVAIKDVPQARMVALARNRMRYLKEKLIADLENPEKIFVLKVGHRQLTAAETEALGQALRSYGPGALLCVCPADATHPEDSIISAAPGVFVGYMDFSGRLDVFQRHDRWLVLCRRMLELRAAQGGMTALAQEATRAPAQPGPQPDVAGFG